MQNIQQIISAAIRILTLLLALLRQLLALIATGDIPLSALPSLFTKNKPKPRRKRAKPPAPKPTS